MENCPIAIVGVSCRFAGAADPGAFWRMIMHRESAIRPLDDICKLKSGDAKLFNDRPYPTHGALLGGLYACVPRDVAFTHQFNKGENQDLYFASQLAFDALADAGIRVGREKLNPINGTVRFGYAPPFSSSTVNWLEHTLFVEQTIELFQRFFRNSPWEMLDQLRSQIISSLPAPDAASFLSGSGHRIAAKIARECSFTGGATTLDAGALSGIAAIRSAMDDLRSGRADMALAGALTPPLTASLLKGLAGEVLFSEGSELVPFSRDACGIIPGEGGAFFVLKREQDALRMKDRIYALVRSVACGTEPLADLLNAAIERAGVENKQVQLVEADGCGSPEYDLEEAMAFQRVWGWEKDDKDGTERERAHKPGELLVGVGSVKGNIGHCFISAAAASVLKAALALKRKVLPPQMPAEHPLDVLNSLSSSVYLLNDARPWITGNSSSPRRAAVTVNDVTGHSAAMILEEEPIAEDRC